MDKFTEILNQSIIYVSVHFNLSHREITAWITKTKNEIIGGLEIGQTIVNVGSVCGIIFFTTRVCIYDSVLPTPFN